MALLLTAITCSLLAELFSRLPFLKATLEAGRVANKAMRVMTARGVSDHWKEKVMLVYAGKLARQTVIIAGLFILWGGALGSLVWLFKQMSPAFYDFLTSWIGFAFTLIWSTLFVILRGCIVRRFV
jgi:hypothetical protein